MIKGKKFLVNTVALIFTALVIVAILLVRHQKLSSDPPTPPSPSLPPNPSPTLYRTIAEVPNVPPGEFRYGGSTSFASLRCEPKKQDECTSNNLEGRIEGTHKDFNLTYFELPNEKNPGSKKGIQMLIANQLTIALSSDAVDELFYKKARIKGLEIKEVPVGYDAIVMYVHPSVSEAISKLTLSQLKDIYTGKITNWSQIKEGSDLEIRAITRNPDDSGTASYFKKVILENENFGKDIEVLGRTQKSEEKVGKTPGGISYAAASVVCNQDSVIPLPIAAKDGDNPINPCTKGREESKEVNIEVISNTSYPITRTLLIVIQMDGRIIQQAGEAYVNMVLSDEGQQLLKEAGLAPIRPVR